MGLLGVIGLINGTFFSVVLLNVLFMGRGFPGVTFCASLSGLVGILGFSLTLATGFAALLLSLLTGTETGVDDTPVATFNNT